MRSAIVVTIVLLTASAASAQKVPAVTGISAAEVQAFLQSLPRGTNTDRAIKVVDEGGYRVGVFGVFRPKTAPATTTVHQTKVTEVYYMLEGSGTLVTGGTLHAPVTPRPSALGKWTDLGSTSIDGGTSRRMAKGDILIIPGNTPHGWASLDSDIAYLIFRPDPDNQIPLK